MIDLLEKYPASTDNLESIENLISQAPEDSDSYYEMLSSAASNPGITAEKLEYFADVTTSISPENADGFKNTLKNLASLDLTPEAIQEISSISDQIDDKDIELLAAQDIQGIVSDIAFSRVIMTNSYLMPKTSVNLLHWEHRQFQQIEKLCNRLQLLLQIQISTLMQIKSKIIFAMLQRTVQSQTLTLMLPIR